MGLFSRIVTLSFRSHWKNIYLLQNWIPILHRSCVLTWLNQELTIHLIWVSTFTTILFFFVFIYYQLNLLISSEINYWTTANLVAVPYNQVSSIHKCYLCYNEQMHSRIIKLNSATLMRSDVKVTCSTQVYNSNTKRCNLMRL